MMEKIKNIKRKNRDDHFFIKYSDYLKKTKVDKDRSNDLIDGYKNDKLYELCVENKFSELDSPVLICVVKNERERMIRFFEHYEKIGVSQFVIIDNDSADGTIDICMTRENVNLYSVQHEYSSARRVAWINQVLDLYGVNRWYLVVDADELIDYVGSERYTINELISEKKPDILIVCFGCPKQEKWIDAHRAEMPGVRVFGALGGSLDVYAGEQKRAPRIFCRLGIEWLWRVVRQPARIRRLFAVPAFLRRVRRQKRLQKSKS